MTRAVLGRLTRVFRTRCLGAGRLAPPDFRDFRDFLDPTEGISYYEGGYFFEYIHSQRVFRVDCRIMSLDLIIGPMFAGKTTEICRLLRRHVIAGKDCIMVKFAGSDRYGTHGVTNHDGVNCNGFPTITSTTLRGIYNELVLYTVVAVDEVQFFGDAFEIIKKLILIGKTVIASGLLADSNLDPFPSVSQLMAISTSVEQLTAICVECGAIAPTTHKTANKSVHNQIGGKELYQALCMSCYDEKNSTECLDF